MLIGNIEEIKTAAAPYDINYSVHISEIENENKNNTLWRPGSH